MSTDSLPDGNRRAVVDRARKAWISRLIDLSRRNNLLYYRPLTSGTLEIQLGDALVDLFESKSVPVSRVLGEEDGARAAAVVSAIDDRARSNREERGLETLFLAIGMATWDADDGGRNFDAPVILLPVAIEWAGRDRSRATLRRSGDPQINLVLVHALTTEFGCALDADELLPESDDDEVVDVDAVLNRLGTAARAVPGFQVTPRTILSNFAFQKLAMVRDLQEHGDAIAAHDVIAALAGDDGARARIRPSGGEPDARQFDTVDPGSEFLVLDADSSQMQAVASALGREHVVIQGPPGTGKSQTIANLIAACAALGKSVLFVAEKRAALEAVHKRLEQVGLAHLALDVHGADVSKKQIMERIRQRLEMVKEVPPVSTDHVHAQFVDRRNRMVEHDRRMNVPRVPSGRSVYQLQGTLLTHRGCAPSRTRVRGALLDAWNEAAIDRHHALVRELGAFESIVLRTERSPWAFARLESGNDAQACVDAARSLADGALRNLDAQLDAYVSDRAVRRPATLREIETAVTLERDIAAFLKRHHERLLEVDLDQLQNDLAVADGNVLLRTIGWLIKARYRNAVRVVRETSREGSVSSRAALDAARQAAALAARWKGIGASQPLRSAGDVDALARAFETVRSHVNTVDSKLDSAQMGTMPLPEIRALVQQLVDSSHVAVRVPAYRQFERQLVDAGFGDLLDEVRAQQLSAAHWGPFLETCISASLLDRVRAEDNGVAGFSGTAHTGMGNEFADLDRQRIHVAAHRVRRQHAELAVAAMNEYPVEDKLVRAEAARKMRHSSLRKLLADAPHVLTKLCPCWMGSPLSVSHLFGPESRWFDIVVFDEASQVLPEDAIPAIMRGSQLVVAGDRHQLPPTTFFADGGSDIEDSGDEEVADAVGFESLLDLMSASSARSSMLRWHYRSRSETLIAFSNASIYQSRLITFPDIGAEPSVRHVQVDSDPASGKDLQSGSAEVARVVDLVLEHAEHHADKSLGVIALGIAHAQRIEAEVRRRLRERPDLDEFFDTERPERFFVKNLERVQGDERESILLTIGHEKDRAGVLPNRLGPLNQQGGERRLNVAITRARSSMTLVTSFSHHDMDPARFRSSGAQMLRKYVEYASNGCQALPDRGSTDFAPNAFETDVHEALEARGIRLTPQWGASSYRLDLVAQHPAQPGRFVLAIECDGASYHSGDTARERDRLRQQHLEALGWRFHRIWSTDWFNNREAEVERAVRAFEDAVKACATSAPSPVRALDTFPSTLPKPSTDRRPPRPPVPIRESIAEYGDAELAQLIHWIASDGRLRTDDEMIEAMIDQLGFSRRGARIVERLRRAMEVERRD